MIGSQSFASFSERLQTRFGPGAFLALAALASIATVSGAERLFWRTWEVVLPYPDVEPYYLPRLLNGLSCAMLVWLAFAVTGRAAFSAALVTVAYGVLVACSYWKIRYLLVPVHPADLFSISQVLHVHLFSPLVLVSVCTITVVVGGFLVGLFRRHSLRATGRTRAAVCALTLVYLGTLAAAPRLKGPRELLGERGVSWYAASPLRAAARNGLMLDFLVRWNELFVRVPAGYGESEIARIIGNLRPKAVEPPAPAEPVNLIVYLLEAFMDPSDLGLRYTSDPTPFFRELRGRYSSGWVISPEFGGRSANAEFELLTGLATYFLPPGSVAYNQFVRRPLPALPRFFTERGYRTTALHADTLAFFNYPEAYRNLGFQRVRTLLYDPNAPRDASGRTASDEALVDAVFEASREAQPFFILAFTNSTHLPYDYPAYRDSGLDVAEELPPPIKRELKTYVNALRAADRAIAKLVAYFDAAAEKTVIAILGDHLPGLAPQAFSKAAFLRRPAMADGLLQSHRCPVVLWANFPVVKRDFELSLNFLGQRILAEMGIVPQGHWAANSLIASRYPVLSKLVQTKDGRRFLPDALAPADERRIREAGLLEYDLLFGRQYALRYLSP